MARNGRTALRSVTKRTYDLIVSDLRMQDMDGESLRHALLDLYGAGCPQMIFLATGHPDPTDIERLDAPVLPKRPEPAALLQDVARVFER